MPTSTPPTPPQPSIPSANGEPTWEAAYLLPNQGEWTEEEFLKFHTNRMAELVNGRLEILPMPTWLHQLIVKYLLAELEQHLSQSKIGGTVLFAPLPSRLFPKTIREPDILYVSAANLPTDIAGYPDKLDLVMEVVSSGSAARRRDYVDKRIDYAKARISEYWIVDPETRTITVLSLAGKEYTVAGEFRAGEIAASVLLPGFQIEVDKLPSLPKPKNP